VTKWAVTTLPPGNLRRGGLTRDLLGLTVRDRQHPRLPRAATRRNSAFLRTITFADGTSWNLARRRLEGKPLMRKLFIVAGLALVIAAPALAQRGRGAGAADTSAAAASKPTPRTADGHPDLSGVWAGSAEPVKALAPGESARHPLPGADEPHDTAHLRRDGPCAKERQAAEPNKPPYKPELASKVQLLSDKRQFNDPSFYCKPLGVPRMGPPSQVVQTQASSCCSTRAQHVPRDSDRRPCAQRRRRLDVDGRLGRTMGRRHAGHRHDEADRGQLAGRRRLVPRPEGARPSSRLGAGATR